MTLGGNVGLNSLDKVFFFQQRLRDDSVSLLGSVTTKSYIWIVYMKSVVEGSGFLSVHNMVWCTSHEKWCVEVFIAFSLLQYAPVGCSQSLKGRSKPCGNDSDVYRIPSQSTVMPHRHLRKVQGTFKNYRRTSGNLSRDSKTHEKCTIYHFKRFWWTAWIINERIISFSTLNMSPFVCAVEF